MEQVATVGVDMGTAHVRVSLIQEGTPVLVEDSQGAALVPAVVCFEPQKLRFGRAALDHAWAAPDKTVRGAKRMLAHRFEHPIVQGYKRFFPIEADPAGAPLFGANGAAGAPEKALASLLGYLAAAVMGKLEAWPTGVVLTEPGWFDRRQSDALRAAAKSANLNVVRVLPDAVAALLPMALSAHGEQRVAVIDVGAGGVTATIAIVDQRRVKLLGSAGDASVGGDDVDVANTVAARIWLAEKESCDVRELGQMELLRQACEQIKVELTGAQTANRFLPFVQPSTGGPPPTFTLKRADFEPRLADLLRAIETCCRRALTEAKSNPTDIQSLLLVGGMSRVPAVRAHIEALFSHRALGGIDPMRAVALGAALAAAAHDGQIAPFAIDEAAWCVGRNPIDVTPPKAEPSESTAATPPPVVPTLPSPAAEPQPVEEQRSAPPSSVPIAPDFRPSPVPAPPSVQAGSSSVATEYRSSPFAAPPIVPELRSTPFTTPPDAQRAAPSAVAEQRSSPFASPPAVHEYRSSPFSAPPPIPSAATEQRSSPFSAPPVDLRSSPFSAPPIDYRSSPHASGAPPVSAPTSLTLASVLDHGRFSNPTTPAQVVGLHISRALSPQDLDPMPLSIFFARILAKKPPAGTLELSSNGSTIAIPMRDGHVFAKQKEYPQLPKVFAWASGEYKFQRSLSGIEGLQKFGLLRFAVDGLRVIVREFDRHPMEEALGPLLRNVPKIRPDRTRVVDTLNEHEQRLVKLNCDGARTGTDVLHHGGAMPGTLLQLLLILTAFDCLEWSAPQVTRTESLQDQLEKRWARVKNANHFDVLGVHWSATSADVEAAYQVWMKDLAPEGEWFKTSSAICRQLRERVDTAYKVLHDPYKRVSHRREAYPDINVEATVDLMSQRAQALGFRAKDRQIEMDARSTRELITELGGTPPPASRERKDNDKT